MRRRDSLEQLRRILLLAAEFPRSSKARPQLDLFMADDDQSEVQPSLEEVEFSDLIHSLAVELLLLIRMEKAGLVESPMRRALRRRLSLGSMPSLRLLEEWETEPPLPIEPWRMANPWPGREDAYSAGVRHARWLAQMAGATSSRVREIARRLYPMAIRGHREEDLPGLVYSHGLRHSLCVAPSGRPSFRRNRDRMRGNGVGSTPEHLAAELTGMLMRECETTSGAMILDPACGSGVFLLAAAAMLAAAPEHAGAESEDELACRLRRLRTLHGVDLDPRAARIAAWNLSLWAAQEAGAAAAEQLDAIFGSTFPYFLGGQIQTGNALLQEASSFSPGFNWERRFPDVFNRERPGFDLVVGNPPWISYGLRDRIAASAEERDYYERLYPAGTQYKLTMYPLFMELALQLCRPGGAHGFLVPDSVLTGHHFSKIRKLLLTTSDLIELILVEGGIWQEASTGYTLIYAVRKKGGSRQGPKSVRNRVLRLGNGEEQRGVWVPTTSYSTAGSAPLRIFRDEKELGFLARIQESPFRFRDVTWTYSGLIGRHGQKSIQSTAPVREFLVHDRHGRSVLEDPSATTRWRPALLSGGEVANFRVMWRGGHVYLPEDRAALTKIYKSGFDLQRYAGPKVFLRQTGDRLIAARDTRGFYCLNNLHIIGPLDWAGIDPLLLTGILTSEPVQRAYGIFSLERSRPLAQVDLKIVEELPYPSDSGGVPIGAGRAARKSLPQARRVARVVDKGVRDGIHGPVMDLAAAAWKAGGNPFGDGSMAGREVLTVLMLRLLEGIEAAAGAGDNGENRHGRTESAARLHPAYVPDLLGAHAGLEQEPPRPSMKRGGAQPQAAAPDALLDRIVAMLFQLPGV